jgi:hypothetical protein
MMRFVCVVALFAVIASAAGGYSTCPSASVMTYSNTTGCDAVVACASSYCTCIKGTVSGGVCSKTDATCDVARGCSETFLDCMETNARTVTNTSACWTALKDLKSSLTTISTGLQMWNASNAHAGCKHAVCLMYNQSTSGTCNSTNSYEAACYGSPVTYQGQISIGGNWSKIFSNATALKEAEECLAIDLTNQLRYPVTVISVTKAKDDTAVVEYSVDAAKTAVDSEITAASGSTAWLKCLSAAKFTQLGGSGTLSVKFTDTPTPVPVTPTPGTTPSPPTPSPPAPPASASMMWSAVQVIAAVVAVLVIA